jgi:hypothetical protein
MIFGWVMALELVFFVQILSCPDFFLTSFKKSGQLKILMWQTDRRTYRRTEPNTIVPSAFAGRGLKINYCISNKSCQCQNLITGWMIPDSNSSQAEVSTRSNDFWLSYGPWTCIFCSNFKLSGLFFDVLWDIDLIFGMWLYLDELQFKFEFHSGRYKFSINIFLKIIHFIVCFIKVFVVSDKFDFYKLQSRKAI